MNLKIKIYVAVLAGIYLFIVLGSLFTSCEDMHAGWSKSERERETGRVIDEISLSVTPKGGEYAYPERYKENTTEVSMATTRYKMRIESERGSTPSGIVILKGLAFMLLFFSGIGMLAFPFFFYKVIRQVAKNDMINKIVVSNIRRMGYILLYVFAASLIYEITNILIAKSLINLPDYDIVYGYGDFILLLLSFGTLLLAEILNVSLKIKEEQDLTI